MLIITLYSCKKDLTTKSEILNTDISLPTLEKNVAAPNGVLHFKNKESLGAFMEKLRNGATPESGSLPVGFASLRQHLDDFEKRHPKTTSDITLDDDNSLEEQYFYDLDKYIVEDEEVEFILNEDLQVMVGDKFYQMTRIGLLVVNNDKLQEFASLYELNEDDLYYNKNFTSFMGETLLTSDAKTETFKIIDGITRIKETAIYLMPFIDDDAGSGGSGGGSGGGGVDNGYPGGFPEGSVLLPPPEAMDTYTTGTGNDFDLEVHKNFNDRRFKFQAYNHNLLWLNVYKTVGIKGKLQRARQWLWVSWWSASWADEIIVGIENMDLRTKFTWPYPHQYNTLPRPSFNGVSKQTLGNWSFDVVNVDVNLSASFLGYTYNLTTNSLNTLINGQLNDFKNNQFDNLFTKAVDEIGNSFDPTFKQRYKDYAMNVQTLDNANSLKFACGYVTKPETYSHINRWTFDWNVGLKYTSNGGLSGNAYGYDMKHGSFIGKARVGSYWTKFRIIAK